VTFLGNQQGNRHNVGGLYARTADLSKPIKKKHEKVPVQGTVSGLLWVCDETMESKLNFVGLFSLWIWNEMALRPQRSWNNRRAVFMAGTMSFWDWGEP